VVLTVQTRYYRYQDESVPGVTGIRVERTDMMATPLDLYRRWRLSSTESGESARISEPESSAAPGFFRQHFIALLRSPDPYWGWYVPAVRAGNRLIEQEGIRAIFSSGPPWISHLVAGRLQRQHCLPWVADFRDPWGYHPVREDFPGWQHWLNQRLESRCVRHAERVLCNTPRLRQLLVELHPELPAEKFLALSNGFDDLTISQGLGTRGDGRRVLLHIGSLYARRRIDSFCKVLNRLVERGRLPRASFRLVFLGHADRSLVETANQCAPELRREGALEFLPQMKWKEAQEMLWGADILLLFQGDMTHEIPAKFFEYLPTGKPVFAVVKQGALSELVESTGSGRWADPDDEEGITREFLGVLEHPSREPTEVQRQMRNRFHYSVLTAQLADWLRELDVAAQGRGRA
jgi:glycosyltransferase involved in cell wall biosynthesis